MHTEADLQRIVSTLQKVSKSGGEYKASCPVHQDRNPSFYVALKNSQIVCKCFSGCENEKIIDHFKSIGVWPSNKQETKTEAVLPPGIPNKWQGKPVKELYTWKDEYNKLIGYTVRYQSSPKVKDIIPFFAVENNKWKSGKKDEHGNRVVIPLYNSDKISADKTKTIVLVQGEAKADLISNQCPGYIGTSYIGGDSQVEYANFELLKGRAVIVWADNDSSGKQAADKALQILKGNTKQLSRVKIETLRLSEKEDVKDLHMRDGSSAVVDALNSAELIFAQRETATVRNAQFLKDGPIARDPFITGFLEKGLVACIIGPPKVRKSFFAMQMALCAASGSPFIDHNFIAPFPVLYCDLENTRAEFENRAYEMVNNPSLLFTDEQKALIEQNLHYLIGLEGQVTLQDIVVKALECGARLVIIDTIYMVFEGNANDPEEWMKHLKVMAQLSQEIKGSVIYVHHDAKGSVGERSVTDRGAGSGVITRFAAAGFFMDQHEEKEHIVLDYLSRGGPTPDKRSLQFHEGAFFLADTVEPQHKDPRKKKKKNIEAYKDRALEFLLEKGGEMDKVIFDELISHKFELGDKPTRSLIALLVEDGWVDFRSGVKSRGEKKKILLTEEGTLRAIAGNDAVRKTAENGNKGIIGSYELESANNGNQTRFEYDDSYDNEPF